MEGLKRFTQVLAKILEVGNWVALGAMVVLLVATFVPGVPWQSMLVQIGSTDVDFNAYGYGIVVVGPSGAFDIGTVRMFAIGALFVFGPMAMVFRNAYLILKFSRGEGKYSQGATPFQPDVTRMVREIGIFLLSVFAANIVLSTIASAIFGPDLVDSHLNFDMMVLGLLMICLSSAFEQGETLRLDVDGLV